MLGNTLARGVLLGAAALALGGAASPAALVASPEPGVLERVVVIGASASAGFGLPVDLAHALDATVVVEHEPILGLGEHWLFASPDAIAEDELEKALAASPTAVVAVDFLFWFGYGFVDQEQDRLMLLERGIAMLERFECPVVVSTFPDMSEAIGKMLWPGQVPSPASFRALNARVQEWVESRSNVTSIELPALVDALKSGKPFDVAGHRWPPSADVELLQADRLHPTIEGLAALACTVTERLVETQQTLDADDVRLDPAEVSAALHERVERQQAETAARLRRTEGDPDDPESEGLHPANDTRRQATGSRR